MCSCGINEMFSEENGKGYGNFYSAFTDKVEHNCHFLAGTAII
jgi:hypothetical protein